MIRLTFVGDIALDKPMLKAAKIRGNGEFDFSDVFHTENVFSGSDLVIGNLETCFGGGNRFNTKPYHYNSPDSFCKAVKDAGIGLVSTANNHCMDEGVAGLKRTLQQLDINGIEHTGTFAADNEQRYLVKEIAGVKIAFYSLTYSVNKCLESVSTDDLYSHVNLIGFNGHRISYVKGVLKYVIKPRIRQIKKKLKKQSTIAAHTDKFSPDLINHVWQDEIQKQIQKAREESDLLVVLLHAGGQFNTELGDYSKYIVDWLCDLGADVIIGHHPHTVQRIEKRAGIIIAYSLGGCCLSPSAEYLVKESLPEYSLALHINIDEHSFSMNDTADILKVSEDSDNYATVAQAQADDPGARIVYKRIKEPVA